MIRRIWRLVAQWWKWRRCLVTDSCVGLAGTGNGDQFLPHEFAVLAGDESVPAGLEANSLVAGSRNDDVHPVDLDDDSRFVDFHRQRAIPGNLASDRAPKPVTPVASLMPHPVKIDNRTAATINALRRVPRFGKVDSLCLSAIENGMTIAAFGARQLRNS